MAVGGPIGALLGAVAGHYAFDRQESPEAAEARRQIVFTMGVIALSAKMARADGIVTADEVQAFGRVVEVSESERRNVERLFHLAQQTVDGYQAYAKQIADQFGEDRALLEDVLDALFEIAKADGAVHERELAYLSDVASIFGFGEADFRRIAARHVAAGSDPYTVLGLSPDADAETIRKRYRALVVENHPDRAIARGLPEEFVRVATERLAAINAAYDRIAQERGL
ncbi:DnaJ-like protein DjlA [Lutibaculum baratangense AMV1]|uniref:DnaJ-like protein DjlA n=2 Tax=Lutibaculum TaxID=1358438 RepID=V4RWF7_9HYPH|nr:DnaJ-like protein DjlA [Lutibaculum baratangense AMV1]